MSPMGTLRSYLYTGPAAQGNGIWCGLSTHRLEGDLIDMMHKQE